MPVYQWKCSKGHNFEDYAFMMDDPGTCPECGEVVKKHGISPVANTTMISGTERAPTNKGAIKRIKY